MKIAVFGKSGQLGRALQRYIDPDEIYAEYYDRTDCDLSADAGEIKKFVSSIPTCDVVIIAAAYTGVEQAETERDLVFAVNTNAPIAIAAACKERGIPLIYISTDYVFDGNSRLPYKPSAATNPLNQYGLSKQKGERGVLDVGGQAAILRTSWIFDGTGRNFLTTMLKLAGENKPIRVINDQIGRPTYAGHFAQAVLKSAKHLVKKRLDSTGVFHITNSGAPVSWAGFARAIFAATEGTFGRPVELLEISSEDYGGLAKRPEYSVLDIADFETSFGYTLPDWHEGLSIALTAWHRDRG